MTTVGTGKNRPPQTTMSLIFCIFTYLCGVLIFATIVGNAADMIVDLRRHREKYHRKVSSFVSSCFSHYVTKILYQNKSSVRKGLRFTIEDAWISKLLRDAAKKALIWVKNVTDFLRFCYLNIPCLRINITLIFLSSSSDIFTLLLENSKPDVSVGFRPPHLCDSKGHQHGVYIQSFENFGKKFSRISLR